MSESPQKDKAVLINKINSDAKNTSLEQFAANFIALIIDNFNHQSNE